MLSADTNMSYTVSSKKDDFLTKENMQLCERVFSSYMRDKYDFDIHTQGKTTKLRPLLLDVMKDIEKKFGAKPDTSIKDMNNMVLNITRDYFKTTYKINPKSASKPVMEVLERDQNVYGPRIMNFEQIKPEATFKRAPIEDEFDREQQVRHSEGPKAPIVPEMKPITENAFDPDEFQKRMNDLERRRDDIEVPDLNSLNATRLQQDTNILIPQQADPKSMYTMTRQQNQLMESSTSSSQNPDNATSSSSFREQFITPAPKKTMVVEKYIAVNGFDRLWDSEKSRFSFKVDFNQGDNSVLQNYKNVRAIETSRVIIPMEIQETVSLNNVPKTFYNHEFSFAYPYIMLYIDEFADVYNGTNSAIRQTFCQLVFDKCYKSPNGRGFIILNPIQKERKVFYPSALSSIGRMTISLRKPNGDLLNASKDEYKIFKVEYEARNTRYLKIVTNVFYDKNEFYKGDNILFKGYTMTRRDLTLTDQECSNWNEYINRPSGHEILEIGQANDRGYFRNFYIDAPGRFNEETGEFVVDDVMITALNKYNDTINFAVWTETNGNILNCSLQCCLSFKLQTIVSDIE